MRRTASVPLMGAAIALASSWWILERPGVVSTGTATSRVAAPAIDENSKPGRFPSHLVVTTTEVFPPGPGRVVGRVRVAPETRNANELDGFDSNSKALGGVLVYVPGRPRDVPMVIGGPPRVLQMTRTGGVAPRTIVLHPDQQLRFSNLRDTPSSVTWWPHHNDDGEVWLPGRKIGGPVRLEEIPGTGTLSAGWTLFHRLEPRPFPIVQHAVRGSIHVLDHTLFSITSDRGAFEIAGLPPGEQRIEFWHPDAERRPISLDVEVVGQGTQRVTVGSNTSSDREYDIVTLASTKEASLDVAVVPAVRRLVAILSRSTVRSVRVEALEGRYFATAAASRLVRALERQLAAEGLRTDAAWPDAVIRMYPVRRAAGRHQFLCLARDRRGTSLGREMVTIELTNPSDRAVLEARTFDATLGTEGAAAVAPERPGRVMAARGSRFGIEIVSTGRYDAPIPFDERAAVFDLAPDQGFAVVLVNEDDRPVAVDLSVDGFGVREGSGRRPIDRSEALASPDHELFVVGPRDRVLVPGWLTGDSPDAWSTRFGPAPPAEGRGQVTAVFHRLSTDGSNGASRTVDTDPIAAVSVQYARTGDHTDAYVPVRVATNPERTSANRGRGNPVAHTPDWSPPPLPPPWPRTSFASLAESSLDELRTILSGNDEKRRREAARAIVSRFDAVDVAADVARLAIDDDRICRGVAMRRLWTADTPDSRRAAAIAFAVSTDRSAAHLNELLEQVHPPAPYSAPLLEAVIRSETAFVGTVREYGEMRVATEPDPLPAVVALRSLARVDREAATGVLDDLFETTHLENISQRLQAVRLAKSLPEYERPYREELLRLITDRATFRAGLVPVDLVTDELRAPRFVEAIRKAHAESPLGYRRTELRRLLLRSTLIAGNERDVLEAEEYAETRSRAGELLETIIEEQIRLRERTRREQIDALIE